MVSLKDDQKVVRELAKQYAAAAAAERQARLKKEWSLFNDLQHTSPRVLIYPDGDGALAEITRDLPSVCSDPDYARLERWLRLRLFHLAYFHDDMPMEPVYRIPYAARYTGYTYGLSGQETAWGLTLVSQQPVAQGGTYHMESSLNNQADVETILAHRLEYIIDDEKSASQQAKMAAALDGILAVELQVNYSVLVASLLQELVHLRNMPDLLMDLYDHPDWIHAVLAHMSASKIDLLRRLEREGRLSLNNLDHYTGSGGAGYTSQLPAQGYAGRARLRDLWGFADAQEFTDVSAAMFKNFILPYQARVLQEFGLVSYGCCERLDKKLDLVLAIPRLRRVSVSPWTNVRVAAEAIGRSCIFSWKYNPVAVTDTLDEKALARDIRETLAVAAGCNLEIILKDIRTCSGRIENLTRWIDVVQGIVKG